ncbi:hypothetical protein [Dyadobacter sp. CY356]|uniref:hypothetical protein n=1 Tax=Dyadobacter sp. CY356 TaxID=2906442 RepID=UPI001F43CDF1|nr:hypothetical protein [Dyadobacter sp. CY356]MCF0058966.1 hypothetical protein [Dyadobacter sp. CY356]
MKTKYLLPHHYQIFGWVATVLGLSIMFWGLLIGEAVPFKLEISFPWPFTGGKGFLDSPVYNGMITHDIADELLCILMITGLFIVAFSRQKIEDERIAQIRLEALQWGIYANYIMLFVCVLLIYGGSFLMVLSYNMFTPLLIFIARFYWLLTIRPALQARKERSLS